jgi:hypothetical protein
MMLILATHAVIDVAQLQFCQLNSQIPLVSSIFIRTNLHSGPIFRIFVSSNVASPDRFQLLTVQPAPDQNHSRPNRQTKEPTVKFPLFRTGQIGLVPVLPALAIDVSHTTLGYPLQAVPELSSEVIHVSNVDWSCIPSRSVVFLDLQHPLQAGCVRASDHKVHVTSPHSCSTKIYVQGNFKTANCDHWVVQASEPPVQPLPNGVDVRLVQAPDGQLPLRVGDGHKIQGTGVGVEQPVGFGDQQVPVLAASEPTPV